MRMKKLKVARYPEFSDVIRRCAKYYACGSILESDGKIYLSDAVPLAIGGSGKAEEIEALARAIFAAAEVSRSVDTTLSLFAGALRKIGEKANFDSPAVIALGAISETRGPVSLVFCTYRSSGGIEPFKLHDIKSTLAAADSASDESSTEA